MKKSIIIWLAAALLVAVAVYTMKDFNSKPGLSKNAPAQGQQASVTPEPSPSQAENTAQPEEQQAPAKTNLMKDFDFQLEDLQGNKVSLSDFKGKKVFLNFWATWCPPCKAEMPDIEKYYQETKDTDVVILAVNVGDDKKTVESFIKDKGYNFRVLLDTTGEVSQMYRVSGIPTSYFINTEGFLDDGAEGAISLEAMRKFVDNLE
ncbi:MAG: redoxin domain-containing protein [Pseudomonadota bacterium]